MKTPTWRKDLADYLTSVSSRTLVYGQHDCVLFAAGAAGVQLGEDLVGKWRGTYTDLRTGLKALRRAGYEDYLEIVRERFAPVPVAFGQEGDIAAVGAALGIVTGASIYVLRNEIGRAHV